MVTLACLHPKMTLLKSPSYSYCLDGPSFQPYDPYGTSPVGWSFTAVAVKCHWAKSGLPSHNTPPSSVPLWWFSLPNSSRRPGH